MIDHANYIIGPPTLTSMETREDLHRITVGTVQDWQKLRSNCRRTTLASLQSQVLANDLSHETDALLAHIDQVCL